MAGPAVARQRAGCTRPPSEIHFLSHNAFEAFTYVKASRWLTSGKAIVHLKDIVAQALTGNVQLSWIGSLTFVTKPMSTSVFFSFCVRLMGTLESQVSFRNTNLHVRRFQCR